MKGRRSQIEALPVPDVDLLFIGDSITDGGSWNEWFNSVELTTANRGVGGDRTTDVLARHGTLGAGRATFVMIGTNDLAWGTKPKDVAVNFERILDLLPLTALHIQSVLPRQAVFADVIEELNALYRNISDERGAHFVDLWPTFSTPNRALRPEFTNDNLHLNGAGYKAWVEQLRPHVRELT